MPLSNPALWDRLQIWLGPQAAAHPLVTRSIEALEVSPDRARAMIEGYARFIYLVAVSEEMLAPPKLIDEVWHLHLADHDDYLGTFSRDVVGRYIRHNKGRPPPADDPAYARSLARYREEFDQAPFAKLWPPPAAAKSRLPMLSLGVAVAMVLVGWLTRFDGFFGLGLVLGAGVLIYLILTEPWRLGKRGDAGGCGAVSGSDMDGGGDGCGGD